MLMTKHVDDLKIGGLPPRPENVLQKIEKDFGPMERHRNEFTNCGVHQKRHPNGDIEWDQDDYIKDLIPIEHHELTGKNAEDKPSEHLAAMFWSLLSPGICSQHTTLVSSVRRCPATSHPESDCW